MFLGNDKGRIMSKVAMPLTNCRFANIVSGPTITKIKLKCKLPLENPNWEKVSTFSKQWQNGSYRALLVAI